MFNPVVYSKFFPEQVATPKKDTQYEVSVYNPETNSLLLKTSTQKKANALRLWQKLHPLTEPNPVGGQLRNLLNIKPAAHPLITSLSSDERSKSGCYCLLLKISHRQKMNRPGHRPTGIRRTHLEVATIVDTNFPFWVGGPSKVTYNYSVSMIDSEYVRMQSTGQMKLLDTSSEILSEGTLILPAHEGPFNLESLKVAQLLKQSQNRAFLLD